MQIMLSNIIRTPDGTILECLHRHDYQAYQDKVSNEIYINDGLGYYCRRSVNIVPYEDLSVTTADPFELQRSAFKWRSRYDKNMQLLDRPVYRLLKDMSDSHIQAILDTQEHIADTYVQRLFEQELEYRKANNITVKE
jgi:hypothetical protein